MATANLKIGFYIVTEDMSGQAFDVTLSDKRTGRSVNFDGLPLMDYDELLDALKRDQSIECFDRLIKLLEERSQ